MLELKGNWSNDDISRYEMFHPHCVILRTSDEKLIVKNMGEHFINTMAQDGIKWDCPNCGHILSISVVDGIELIGQCWHCFEEFKLGRREEW